MLQPGGTSPQRAAGSMALVVLRTVGAEAICVPGEKVSRVALGMAMAGRGVLVAETAVARTTNAGVGCKRICKLSSCASSKAMTIVAITPPVRSKFVRHWLDSAGLFMLRWLNLWLLPGL